MAREVDDRLGRELKLEKDALRVIQRSAPLLAERGVEVEGEMDLSASAHCIAASELSYLGFRVSSTEIRRGL